ncbi:MAG: ankyrin repeat domain-containing protein [Candidatus Contendobacter sp.]|nr:ankyrin repeat domain-containing protein [Candidatus Contendobacter sp.]MDS4060688.1 ankyrin repeat domain-containing protein [Candidatus Contendobacter sp.]
MKAKLMTMVGLTMFLIDSSMADDVYRWTDPTTGKILMTNTPPGYWVKEQRPAGKLPNGDVIELIFDPNDPNIKSITESRKKRDAENAPAIAPAPAFVEQVKPRPDREAKKMEAEAEMERRRTAAELAKQQAAKEREMEQRAAMEREKEQRAAMEREKEQRAAREMERRKVETLQSDYLILDSCLIAAAHEGDMETVRYLADIGVDVNTKSKNGGLTALMMATMNGHTKLVSLLLERGADVNMKTEDGYTALMMASNLVDIDIVKLLLNKGADVHANSTSGLSAFDIASKNSNPEIMKILLSRK